MRIGIDIRPLLDRPLSGVGEYTLRLITAMLRQAPPDVHFVFCANSLFRTLELPHAWPKDRYTVVQRRLPNKLLNASLAVTGLPSFERLFGNVELVFVPNQNFVPRTRVPLVLTVHDLSFHHYPDLFSFKRRWWHRIVRPERLMQRADALITVSRATASDVQSTFGIPAERIHVIHSGVDAPELQKEEIAHVRQAYHLPEHFLFSLSTIEPRKNLLTLLDAFTILKQDYGYKGDLVIAGAYGWSARAFGRALAAHPFRHAIRMLSYVRPEEKAALYRAADVFLYLSLFEGFGFPPLEAAMQGTPVVTGHHSSLCEVMENGALLVDVHNVREVAVAVHELLGDAEIRSHLAENHARLTSHFSWERSAQMTLTVFRDILQSSKRGVEI